MAAPGVLELTDAGLYCRAGDFHIDPWRGVDRAVITHAHSDHARPGSRAYLASPTGALVLRARLGDDCPVEAMAWGETRLIGGARVSLHPAGHLLGSAQVRIEVAGQVWVVTGDYKVERDATCEPFEVVRCHGLVTESTFGLPVYRWRPQAEIFDQIHGWWRANQAEGRASLLYAYSLGKAQRLLGGLDAGIGPILVHGSLERCNAAYAAAGVALAPSRHASVELAKTERTRALVIAPPSADASPWVRKFGDASRAMASGWMALRGTRRRRAFDRGFALSDHADWPGLLATIEATGAETVWVTHGYAELLARYLRERGRDARAVATRFTGETMEERSEEGVEAGALGPQGDSAM